jgi:hypothetical protein
MSRDDHHGPIDPALIALETALGGLVPAADPSARDRILYRAGAASVRPRRSSSGLWMALAASLGAVALGEGALLARRPVVERIVIAGPPEPAPMPMPAPAQVEPVPIASEERVATSIPMPLTPAARLSWQIARFGLDGLPARPSPVSWERTGDRTSNGSEWHLREELLREFGETGGPAS